MDWTFRNLKPNEIEVRVGSVSYDSDKKTVKGASFLLYKTSRVDYAILDETFGTMNWQCEYKEIKGNMYCGISIYDEEKEQWITKWNCGVESNTEQEKGEASDAFKRSAFAWNLGVELYTSPFIYIAEKDYPNVKNAKLSVKEIEYNDNKEITRLVIVDNKNTEVFTYPKKWEKKTETKVEAKPKQVEPEEDNYNGLGYHPISKTQIATLLRQEPKVIDYIKAKCNVTAIEYLTYEQAQAYIDKMIEKGKLL